MRIHIVSLGTRGDTQPMIALGKGLQNAGYDVTLVTGSNFAEWVESQGLKALPISLNMQDVMNSPEGIAWMESRNPGVQLQNMRKVMGNVSEVLLRETWEYVQESDVILSGFTTEGVVDSATEKLGIPHIRVPLQPLEPSQNGRSSLYPPFQFSKSWINGVFAKLTDYMLMRMVFKGTVNNFRKMVNMPEISTREILRRVRNTPTVYGFSKEVVPIASDWPDNIHLAGYWFLDEATDWAPSDEFQTFLDSGEAPIFVGFGSMSTSDPESLTHLIFDAIEKSGARAVIQSGWAGLGADAIPDTIYMLGTAPHSQLFPRMSAIVHHGGAGTTAAGIRAGKPGIVVSHMPEQKYWGNRLYDLNAGSQPIPRQKVSVETLADAIQYAMRPQIKAGANALGERVRAEDGVATAVKMIQGILNR